MSDDRLDLSEERFDLKDPISRALARRNDARFLGSRITNRAAAERLQVSQSYLSEWKKKFLPRFFAVCAAHDIQLLDLSDERVAKKLLQAYKTLAFEHMASVKDAGDTTPGTLVDSE